MMLKDMLKEMRIFQKFATSVLVIFLSLMVFVTIVAYNRTSGSTRQDMSEAHLVRKANFSASQVAEATPVK